MMTLPMVPCPSTDEPRPCLDRLRAELAASSYPAVRHLNCYLDQDQIVLCGIVPNYYLKQCAQSLLLRLSAGLRLQNRLEVTNDRRRNMLVERKPSQDEELCFGIGNDY